MIAAKCVPLCPSGYVLIQLRISLLYGNVESYISSLDSASQAQSYDIYDGLRVTLSSSVTHVLYPEIDLGHQK